jgi:hypothetical protein
MTYEQVQDLQARQKRQPGRHWSLATSVLAVSISFWTFIWDYSTLEGASFGIGEQRHTSRCN